MYGIFQGNIWTSAPLFEEGDASLSKMGLGSDRFCFAGFSEAQGNKKVGKIGGWQGLGSDVSPGHPDLSQAAQQTGGERICKGLLTFSQAPGLSVEVMEVVGSPRTQDGEFIWK